MEDTVNINSNKKSAFILNLFSSHPRLIGIRYAVSLALMLLIGLITIIILLVKTHLFGMVEQLPEYYGSLTNLHSSIMLYYFIIPLLIMVSGNLWLPHYLKNDQLSFPRLNNIGWLLYFIGCILCCIGIVTKGSISWTLYNSYHSFAFNDFMILSGLILNSVSIIIMSIIIISSIHTVRDKQIKWADLPIFVYSFYIGSILMIFSVPMLLVYLVIIQSEMLFSIGILNPVMGGDLFYSKQFFWIFTHPILFALFIISCGFISEILVTYSKTTGRPDKTIKCSLAFIAGFSLFGWGQHLYLSGLSVKYALFHSFIGLVPLMLIPLISARWIKAILRNNIIFSLPVKLSLFSIISIFAGCTMGMFMIIPSVNKTVHNTSFITAHTHLFFIGVIGFSFIGMLIHFWTNIWKLSFRQTITKIAIFSMFLGLFLFTFSKTYAGIQGFTNYQLNNISERILFIIDGFGDYFILQGAILFLLMILITLLKKTFRTK